MKKIILIVLSLVVVVALVMYYMNGGFGTVQVTETTSTTKYVAGQYYEGPVRSAEFSEIFKRAGQLQQSSQLPGSLGGIYYNNPDEAKGKIKAFVGVVVNSPEARLPSGYELRTLEAGLPVLEVYLKANQSLIPGKAYPALFDYAKEKDIPLRPLYFEEFPDQNSGRIWVFRK